MIFTMITVKSKKRLLIATFIFITMVTVVVLFVSPLTKYLIQKNDEKWFGRQVKIGWLYVNPFTGSARIKNLKILEQGGDSLFFSVKGLNIRFAILKLLHKTYEIKNLSLNDPEIWIIQNKKKINFDDLIQKFTQAGTHSDTTEIHHFNILKIKIHNGVVHYAEKSIPVDYFVKNVNIESPGMRWNVDTVALKFSFVSGPSTGSVKGNGSVNLKNLDYRMAVVAEKYDLQIIQQYLRDLANYGSFSASLDADIKATGNISDKENLNTSGLIALNDFHLGKSADEDYLSFNKLALAIKKLCPEKFEYNYDSVILVKPYIKYEIYDHLDNLQRMFGKGGADIKAVNAQRSFRFNLIIELAQYVKVLSKNFFMSNFKVGRMAIQNGYLQFNDYSLNEKFSIAANPFNIRADSINKKNKRVDIFLNSGLKPYGNLRVELSINPNDTGEFDLNYHLKKLPVTIFNPYVITYTSYPLDRGTLELNGSWKVRNGKIQSDNHLIINDPHLAIRLKRKDSKRLPVPLLLAFIRERDNLIDYDIPITGDLKNPKFNLWNVVTEMLGNILIKPPSIPYMSHVKHMNNELENYLTVKWMTRQVNVNKEQKDFLEKMNDFLKENPGASISVTPEEFEEKEKEYILFYESKKKFWLASHESDRASFSKEDSAVVDKISSKDSLFVRFINSRVTDTMLFTIQEKCMAWLGKTTIKDSGNYLAEFRKKIDLQFSRLVIEREKEFRSFFKDASVANRIKFLKDENRVPFNGFSFYKIDYNGDIPKNLKKAYLQMNDSNGNH
jgi:hypothetical protein